MPNQLFSGGATGGMMFGQPPDQNQNTFNKDIFTEFLGNTGGGNPNTSLFSPVRKNEEPSDGLISNKKYSGLNNEPMIPIQEETYSH